MLGGARISGRGRLARARDPMIGEVQNVSSARLYFFTNSLSDVRERKHSLLLNLQDQSKRQEQQQSC